MPGLSNWTKRVVPLSYSPRSKRLPSNREKTLWKIGSWLGNSTLPPTGTTRSEGWKLLFLCTSCGIFEASCRGLSEDPPMGVSQITALEACLVRRPCLVSSSCALKDACADASVELRRTAKTSNRHWTG